MTGNKVICVCRNCGGEITTNDIEMKDEQIQATEEKIADLKKQIAVAEDMLFVFQDEKRIMQNGYCDAYCEGNAEDSE